MCELLSHHLFLKWWCDPWGVWFTFKSWFTEPWGQIEPHTNSSSCWMNTCVTFTKKRECYHNQFILPPTIQSSLQAVDTFPTTTTAGKHKKVERDWWNAPGSWFLSADTDEPTEARLWLVAGRTPSWECYSAGFKINELVAHPFKTRLCNVMTACGLVWVIPSNCRFLSLFRSWWEQVNQNIPPSLYFGCHQNFNTANKFGIIFLLSWNHSDVNLFSLRLLHLQQNKIGSPLCHSSSPRSMLGGRDQLKDLEAIIGSS